MAVGEAPECPNTNQEWNHAELNYMQVAEVLKKQLNNTGSRRVNDSKNQWTNKSGQVMH